MVLRFYSQSELGLATLKFWFVLRVWNLSFQYENVLRTRGSS